MYAVEETTQPSLSDFQIEKPSPAATIHRLSQFASDTQAGKRSFDFSAALAILLCILPLVAIVSLAILLMQGRPVFIRHMRIGHGGREFPCFKFRTMINGADTALQAHLAADPAARAEWEASRKLRNDPRITPLGSVLRKSSVDEIPQLLNILRGEMSMVGPRPIVRSEIRYYGAAIEKYYRVRPGVTGAWQIGGRSDTSYEHRVKLDTLYVEHQSFLGDIWILVKTVPAVFKMRGSC